MRRLHVALMVVSVVIGIAAAITGVWWTVAAMACVLISQMLSLRARRKAHLAEADHPPSH